MQRVPLITNRRDLRNVFSSVIERSNSESELDHRNKIKTYIIESNIADPHQLSGDCVFENTDDPSIKILKLKLNQRTWLSFYVDVEDSRFWKIHSLYDSDTTDFLLSKLVEQNGSRLDYIWMPSSLLEKYMEYGQNTGFGIKFKNQFLDKNDDNSMRDVSMRFWGGSATTVINDLRNNATLNPGISLSAIGIKHTVEEGYVKENIVNFGRFTLMKGNSVDSHLNIVHKIKNNYAQKLKLIEDNYRIKMERLTVGVRPKGSVLYIDFQKPIENVGLFADIIASAKKPFRISGIKKMENSSFVRIFGVDLHTNDLVNMDITPNWMAIYLGSSSCGNVATRLLTNIQSYYSSNVKLVGDDDERII